MSILRTFNRLLRTLNSVLSGGLWIDGQPINLIPVGRIMDHQVVIDAILKRANVADTDALEHALGLLGKDFDQLKERAISLLTGAIADAPDKFLERKLAQVEKLIRADRSTIELSLVPSGRYMTRDTLAMSQGLRPAPHQSLVALGLSATVLENGLDSIEKATREAASHLQRVNARRKKSAAVGTNVFVGHGRALAWREVKDFIEDRLGLPVDEFSSVPVAGITTVDRLSEMLERIPLTFTHSLRWRKSWRIPGF
jgi:hypothetical protein